MIASNIYGMTVLVIILGHGLVKLPIYLWRIPNTGYNLVNALSRAESSRKIYWEALGDYHE